MSGSKQPEQTKKQRSAEISNRNPLVDSEQMRETGKLLDRLAEEGVERRGYGISSPYDRTGMKHYTRRGC